MLSRQEGGSQIRGERTGDNKTGCRGVEDDNHRRNVARLSGSTDLSDKNITHQPDFRIRRA